MKAMLLQRIASLEAEPQPLVLSELPEPIPGGGEILIRVDTCGVCHTELDEIEGRTPPPRLPVILGHQVVGRVAATGPGAGRYPLGTRVGVAWIYSACGKCEFCLAGLENLCLLFRATGRDANGGYAEAMLAPEDYVYQIPEIFSDVEAAPLLCAGAIGYRSLKLSGLVGSLRPKMPGITRLGLSGFGASAHIVLQLVRHAYPWVAVYVFSRSEGEREFARQLGAAWTGDFTDTPPEPLHSIIDTTPAWKPVVEGLRCLVPGGRLVINAIRKESRDQDALLALDYPSHLWLEKEIKSVANIVRSDVQEFLELASEIPLRPEVQVYALQDANQALLELKQRKIRGAKVLQISSP
jgi:alcohol dehydrogenase, propanol-preferring